MPIKERDLGLYNLPVKLGNLEPKGALADLGASISLMLLSIAKKLPFSLRPSRKTIQLADRSIKVPELDNVPIQVGELVVPCDFVVMEMEEDPYTPLILERAVLKILRAVISCHDDTITVEVAQVKVMFKISLILKKPMVEQVCRLEVVNGKFKKYQREIGIGYSEYDEDSYEENEELEEQVGMTQECASKEAEFKPLCEVKEGIV